MTVIPCRILALVPPWTRVYRVQRDIPMPLVTSGVEHGNLRSTTTTTSTATKNSTIFTTSTATTTATFTTTTSTAITTSYPRELALARMKDFGTECRDVRTREVSGHPVMARP